MKFRWIVTCSWLLLTLLSSALTAVAAPPVPQVHFLIRVGQNDVSSVPAGTAVTLSALVITGFGPVLNMPGQVAFCDASAPSCTDIHRIGLSQIIPSSGTASFTFVPGPGIHMYKAEFLGTKSYPKGTSPTETLIVLGASGPPSATVGIQASGSQGNYALLGTVATNGLVPPTGQVTFLDTSNANYSLGSATLSPTGANNTSFFQSFSFQFPTGSGREPGHVAVGDFNNDGHPDILFASTELGAIYVLLGNGDGTFISHSFSLPDVNSDEAPIVADFNSDDKLDFVVRTKTGLAVYLGNGDGTFTAGTILSITPLPTFTVADLNDDGIPDLLVGQGASLYAYFGDGSGGFAAPQLAFQGIIAAIFTLSADFNGDGSIDILQMSAFGNAQVLLGNGDGTFRSGPASPYPGNSLGVGVSAGTIGDLNGDGKLDVIIAEDYASHPPFVLLGNGDGTFTVMPPNPQLISASSAVTVADFNGDGIPDVVFPDLYGGDTNVYIGKGDGTFTPDIYSPGLAYFTSESLATGDFNGDGQADIAEVFQGDYNQLVVLLSQSASTVAGYANNISPVGTGYHYVEGFYPGDANTPAGTSQTIALLAEPVQPNLSLTALPTGGSLQGQSVTLTATLDKFFAQNHSAKGTVIFTSNGNSLGTAQIANGTASLTTSALTAGVDSLQAEYTGDTNFADADSVPLTYTVTAPLAPTITFTVPNHIYGDPPFAASASSNSSGAIIYTLVSGSATISGSTITLTGAGTVTLLASQAASGAYSAGSATATFNVAQSSQTITFAQPASPVNLGAAAITLNATASSGLPVTFSVVSGPGIVNGNSLTPTGTGTIVVAANQAGDTNFSVAPQVTHTITVIGRAVAISLTGTPSPVFLNNPVTLTATLTATGSTPRGAITFVDSGTPIGSAPLAGTTAILSISTLALGTHTITAVYPGDGNFSSQTSPAVIIVVQNFTLTVANPSMTIQHGGTAVYNLVVSSVGGGGMAANIGFSISGSPDHSGINFSPQTIPTGSGTTNVTLTIQTPDYPVGPWSLVSGRSGNTLALTAFAVLLLPLGSKKRFLGIEMRRFACLSLLFSALMSLSGCGGVWRTQSYSIAITASSGSLSHSVNASLISQQ